MGAGSRIWIAVAAAAALAILGGLSAGCPPPPPLDEPSMGDGDPGGDPRPGDADPEGDPKPEPFEGDDPGPSADPQADGEEGRALDDGTSQAYPQAGEPGAETDILGVVFDVTAGSEVPGATATVVGEETTTAEGSDKGRFTLTIPTSRVVLVRVEAEGYLPTQLAFDEPPDAAQGDPHFFPVLPATYASTALTDLGLPALSTGKAVVLLDFDKGVGAKAEIDRDHQGALAIPRGGQATQGAKLQSDKGGVVVFVNVEPGKIEVSLGSSKCRVVNDTIGSFEVTAEVVTAIAIECGG